jgi:hypothetical protein
MKNKDRDLKEREVAEEGSSRSAGVEGRKVSSWPVGHTGEFHHEQIRKRIACPMSLFGLVTHREFQNIKTIYRDFNRQLEYITYKACYN